MGFSGKSNNLQWPALPRQRAYCAEISMEATFAGIELEGCIMWQQVRLKACSGPMVKDCSARLHGLWYGWGGPSEPNPKRNVCQNSRADKMSDSIGFNPVAQIQQVFFLTNEMHPPATEHLSSGLKWRKGRRRQGWICRPSPCFNPSVSAVSCGSLHIRRTGPTAWGSEFRSCVRVEVDVLGCPS